MGSRNNFVGKGNSMRRKNWARAILIGLWIAPLAAWAKDGSGPANLLNPTIGLNALFLAQGSPDLAKPYGLDFQEDRKSVV